LLLLWLLLMLLLLLLMFLLLLSWEDDSGAGAGSLLWGPEDGLKSRIVLTNPLRRVVELRGLGLWTGLLLVLGS
jgi:hypothetical protein